MDYKYIEQLLERYWNCETSLEEEAILRMFFSQDDIPAALLRYKDLFVCGQAEEKEYVLEDSFDERIIALTEGQKHVKAKTVSIGQRFMPLFKAAAMIAIILTLGNASQHLFNNTGTLSAPNTAAIRIQSDCASMAMKDSVKTDTLKKAMQQAIITR